MESHQTGSTSCCSRTLTSSQHTVLLSKSPSCHHQRKVSKHAHEECYHTAQHSSSPSNLNCPRHDKFLAVEHVSPFPMQPASVTVWLPCVWPPQKSTLGPQMWVKDVKAVVIPGAAQWVLWGRDPLAGVSMKCLPQCLQDNYLTKNNPWMGFIWTSLIVTVAVLYIFALKKCCKLEIALLYSEWQLFTESLIQPIYYHMTWKLLYFPTLKKLSLQQAVEAHRVVRHQGYHIFRQSAHRWWWGCWPYALAALYPQGRFLVFISVRGWVNPKAIVRLEWLSQLKNSMTSLGIKPATFWLVA
jgi:hypothetical protein